MTEDMRGVFEVSEMFPGTRTFAIRDADGRCLRVVIDPIERITDETVEALWIWLDTEDPERPALQLHRQGVQAGVQRKLRVSNGKSKPVSIMVMR